MTPYTQAVIEIIQKIPRGKVMTYGQIAQQAGQKKGARQVVRILHSMSDPYHLPWHRVVNKSGKIGIVTQEGYLLQRALLLGEGITFSSEDTIDLSQFQMN